ncbi:MAG: ADP-glyceromanno-heptose 6-epimerase [Parabacteroides sp.]|nr:ADP-glyceromanno-heptose 6-epimerase [Negativicutes bacterium]
MRFVVTGGAGFIGSCIVRTLNDLGHNDIIIVDNIASTEKWKNIRNKSFFDYIQKDRFLDVLPSMRDVTHIIHMGACSSTTEKNFDYLYWNNFDYSRRLWDYCSKEGISFIYASSAATYGDGAFGFSDDIGIKGLIPLNAYGYSKQMFDLWAEKQTDKPKQHVGMKFFNVYGPNEYFKGDMASVIYHAYRTVKRDGKIRLFKSHREECPDGEQKRDFLYVKDLCRVIRFFINRPDLSGLYNLGTGKAETFDQLAGSVFNALNMSPVIEYIDMPESIRAKYQYFTEADINKLRSVGYEEAFHDLEKGTEDYINNYLEKEFLIY